MLGIASLWKDLVDYVSLKLQVIATNTTTLWSNVRGWTWTYLYWFTAPFVMALLAAILFLAKQTRRLKEKADKAFEEASP